MHHAAKEALTYHIITIPFWLMGMHIFNLLFNTCSVGAFCICSHRLPSSDLTVHWTQKGKFDFSNMTISWPMWRKKLMEGGLRASKNAVNHSLKSTWLGDSRDLRRKDTCWSLSQFPLKSIKSRRSFLYKIHHANLLSQEHSRALKLMDRHHEKWMSFVLFLCCYWCISNERKDRYAALA